MTITGLRVIGGTANQAKLTKQLMMDNPKEYQVGKAFWWIAMLNNGQKPTRFYSPTKNGTKAAFEYIYDDLTYHTALGELKGYVNGLNATYPELGMTLDGTEETTQPVTVSE